MLLGVFWYCLGLEYMNISARVKLEKLLLTAVAVISNDRHSVISCKYEAGLVVLVEFGHKCFCLSHNTVHDLDIVHVFLLSRSYVSG